MNNSFLLLYSKETALLFIERLNEFRFRTGIWRSFHCTHTHWLTDSVDSISLSNQSIFHFTSYSILVAFVVISSITIIIIIVIKIIIINTFFLNHHHQWQQQQYFTPKSSKWFCCMLIFLPPSSFRPLSLPSSLSLHLSNPILFTSYGWIAALIYVRIFEITVIK